MNLTFTAPSTGGWGGGGGGHIPRVIDPGWHWLINCFGLAKMRFLINDFTSCHNATPKPAEDALSVLFCFTLELKGVNM